jgi:hypothetical protein
VSIRHGLAGIGQPKVQESEPLPKDVAAPVPFQYPLTQLWGWEWTAPDGFKYMGGSAGSESDALASGEAFIREWIASAAYNE